MQDQPEVAAVSQPRIYSFTVERFQDDPAGWLIVAENVRAEYERGALEVTLDESVTGGRYRVIAHRWGTATEFVVTPRNEWVIDRVESDGDDE